jgi:hypothetical protein
MRQRPFFSRNCPKRTGGDCPFGGSIIEAVYDVEIAGFDMRQGAIDLLGHLFRGRIAVEAGGCAEIRGVECSSIEEPPFRNLKLSLPSVSGELLNISEAFGPR